MDALETAFAEFLREYPAFADTRAIDALRQAEYGRLDARGCVYLDYTGGGLYGDSQLAAHMALLRDNVFGNPHSFNPTSWAATEQVERARAAVLEFFNAPPDEYEVIFTANASGALKIVGESYPFDAGCQYVLTFDNHNSVNGIREFSRGHRAQITYIPLALPDLRVDEAGLLERLALPCPGKHKLFAYPAQSNFSGVQHPLTWIARAQAWGWDVLLDAAAYVPTNRLDLSLWKPDFVPLSFYKMFGYPTGVGCLIARRAALGKLHRPWFAGGTITVASVQGDTHYLAEGAPAFEDGTVNYLALPAVEIGLRHLTNIGMDAIHTRVMCLTGWLLAQLTALHHSNGAPVVRIYGPVDTELRGGTVTMNFYDPQGRFFDHQLIEAEAGALNISVRTGCFCNPGGGETALGISRPELAACFRQAPQRLTFDDFRRCIDNKSTGAVRVSVGLVSNFADVARFVEFATRFVDRTALTM
ncbi:MAG TPA: aminotransferase class V-fold PLP-dependent enzyme [Anaerolineae bacterium]|nr:aminotransferase class V-fold PLP-dependent enzyme [Anaerolineae bacterium]